MRVAIVCKPQKEELFRLLPELIAWLRARNHEPVLDEEAGKYTDAAPVVERANLPGCSPALVIVLGGDGTAAVGGPHLCRHRHAHPQRQPGLLGFLTEVRLADLYATLEGWCSDCYQIDERSSFVQSYGAMVC